MSLSWLVLELWQFSFIKKWPEIRKSKIPLSGFYLSGFYLRSGEWYKSGKPNLAWTFVIINYYSMLQNPRVAAFTFSELLRENKQGYNYPLLPPSPHTHTTPPRTQIGVKVILLNSLDLEKLKFCIVWNLYVSFFEAYIFGVVIFSFFSIFVNFFSIGRRKEKKYAKSGITQLVETCRRLHFSTNWWYLLNIF